MLFALQTAALAARAEGSLFVLFALQTVGLAARVELLHGFALVLGFLVVLKVNSFATYRGFCAAIC